MTYDELHTRALDLIARLSGGARDDHARDALLCDLLRFQSEHVAPYARLCRHAEARSDRTRTASRDNDPSRFRALPTDVFRHTRVALHPQDQDVRVFRTSGTTVGTRGQHHLSDLSLYDAAAKSFAAHALFPDVTPIALIILASDEQQAPDSSLSYMLSRFVQWFGDAASTFVFRNGQLDVPALVSALDRACVSGTPVALLGTSFAFVQAEDSLGTRRWKLPARSRLMQTGGFKGKSREVDAEVLRALLCERYGINDRALVSEYGMTELCSQMYESCLVDARSGRPDAPRRLIAPGWVRVTAVDPETLAPVPHGEIGIARIDDVASLSGCCAIQTADRIRAIDDGFVLLGRMPGSVPRGCSLAIEEALE